MKIAAGAGVALASLFVAVASLFLIAGSSSLYQVVVPAVVEDDVSSAYWDLHDAGFAVSIEEPFSFTDSVTRQTPAPGSEVRRGSVVSLELTSYNGPWGMLAPGADLVMPSLIGDRLDLATDKLQSRGALWGVGQLPPLPAGTAPTVLANYKVRAQHPQPRRHFVQTKWIEPGVRWETRTAWLEAALLRE